MPQIPQIPAAPGPAAPQRPQIEPPKAEDPNVEYKTFGETLNDFVGDVNQLQRDSGTAIERFLTGEIEDVHDVMIAVEKAGVSFELMMEIRNKMIEAYHEVMRMQV